MLIHRPHFQSYLAPDFRQGNIQDRFHRREVLGLSTRQQSLPKTAG